MKDHPLAGGLSVSAKERMRQRLWTAINDEDFSLAIESPTTPSYSSWFLGRYISRPVVVSVASLTLIASGWMTTARAADSLPGDTLYSVKILTEKAQLALASADRKAILHTEFAGHRLAEANELQATSNLKPERAPLVAETLTAYKNELASASEGLAALSSANTIDTVASIQENLNAIDSTLDVTLAQSSDLTESIEVIAAKEATQEASQLATDVVVEVHDKEPSETSTLVLKETFKDLLGDLQARQQFDEQRIRVIEAALQELDPQIVTADPTLSVADPDSYRYTIHSSDGRIDEAMNRFAAGGYRSAFEALNDVDKALLNIEAHLAQIEIAIMQARNLEEQLIEEVEVESLDGEVEHEISEVNSSGV